MKVGDGLGVAAPVAVALGVAVVDVAEGLGDDGADVDGAEVVLEGVG